jgi:hypothetical protein
MSDTTVFDVTTGDGKFRIIKSTLSGLQIFEGQDAYLGQRRIPEVVESLASDVAALRAAAP